MKTLKEKIEVMQAALDGKDIEAFNGSQWIEIINAESEVFDWADLDYRIKPEPMEFWVNVYEKNPCMVYYKTENEGKVFGDRCSDYVKTIKVREVIE